MKTRLLPTACLMLAACASSALAIDQYTTTFSSGTEGWSVSGRNDISATGGNPDHCLDVEVLDVFGADIRNDDNNPNFIGDYTTMGPFRVSVDVQVTSVDFFGSPVTRDMIVEFRDYSKPPKSGLPYVSVYTKIGVLESGLDWSTFGAMIEDPLATELPEGWGGYGDEDQFGTPFLPADRTFTSVLQHVDEIHFTTFVPGFFYGFTNFVMKVDNISIDPVDSGCYPDCDGDTNLTIDDFICFQTLFALGDPTADCDGDGNLTIDDFICFQTTFAIGC